MKTKNKTEQKRRPLGNKNRIKIKIIKGANVNNGERKNFSELALMILNEYKK